MKTASQILNEHLLPATAPNIHALEEYASEQCQKRDKLTKVQEELIEWLDQECPSVAPPLEPYTNYDLTHDFCDGLRIRLDKIEQLKKQLQ